MRRKLPERYVQINGDTRGDSRLMWILFFKGGDVGVDHEMMRVHMDTEAIAEIQAEGGARRIDGILAELHEKLREDNPNILPANYLDELGQKWQKEEYKEDGQVEFYRKGDM